MVSKISIGDLNIDERVYPRKQKDHSNIEELVHKLEAGVELEPIVVQPVVEDGNEKIIILNGGHRIDAYRKYNQNNQDSHDEVPVEFWKSEEPVDLKEDMDEMLTYAHQINDKQGLNMRPMDTRHTARILKRRNPEWTEQEIADKLSRDQSRISQLIKDIVQEQRASEQQLIVNLRLMGWKQNKIAEYTEKSEGRVSQIFSNISTNKIKDFYKNKGKSPEQLSEMFDISIPAVWHYILEGQDDEKRFNEFGRRKYQNTSPNFYNVWSYQSRDPRLGVEFKGNVPGQIVMNLLYFYTEQGDLIVDPMAGGGPVIDTCLVLNRKCRAYDISPIDSRREIEKNNIMKGYPKETKKADFVFLDPPYYNMVFDDYQDVEEFYKFIEKIAKETKKLNATVGFLMQDMTEKENHCLSGESYRIFRDYGFKYIDHISCPLSTEQFNAYHLKDAKKNKRIIGRNRDLYILKG